MKGLDIMIYSFITSVLETFSSTVSLQLTDFIADATLTIILVYIAIGLRSIGQSRENRRQVLFS